MSAATPPAAELQALLRVVAALLLALTLAVAPRALARAFAAAAPTPAARRALAFALGVALCVRLAVPGQLIEVGTGYALLDDIARGGPLPRYGAGQAALLGPLFALLTPTLAVVFAVHALLATASVALVAGVVGRFFAPSAAAGPAAALAVALLPVSVLVDRSEAAAVPASFALLVALNLSHRAERPSDRLGAACALAFAGHTRPELLLAGPLWLLALPGARGPGARRAVALAAIALAPQVLFLALRLGAHASAGDLPALSPSSLALLPLQLIGFALPLWPHAFPAALAAAAGLGLVVGLRRAASPEAKMARWLALALPALLIPGVADPVVVSLPRLQHPGLLVVAGFGAAVAWPRWGVAGPGGDTAGAAAADRRLRGRRALLIAAWLVSAVLTIPWLYRPDNYDGVERVWRDAAALLAGQRGSLHVLSYDDAGVDKVSRHHPGWRVRPPRAHLRLRPLRELPAEGEAPAEPTYVLLDPRCAAKARPLDAPAPQTFDQPACAALRLRRDLRVLRRWTLPNAVEGHFPWWPLAPTLEAELYQMVGPGHAAVPSAAPAAVRGPGPGR